MKILVLGAGGVGGYFGGRLAEKGEDVTFLVRDKRKLQLEQTGLKVHSVKGDFSIKPKLLTKAAQTEPFDLILFSTKAYHTHEAIADVSPFVGENTVILPLLNGRAHFEQLQQAFGAERVIGGLCFIETTLNEAGEVVQTSATDRVVYGEFNNAGTERIDKIEAALSGTKAAFVRSDSIEQEIWQKYLFITTFSGVTTLMRAPIGPIRESEGGKDFIQQLMMEVEAIIQAEQAPIAENIVETFMQTMEQQGYEMKSSMQRDMEKSGAVEADHLQGYFLTLAKKHQIKTPLLQTVYQNLKVYEEMNRKR